MSAASTPVTESRFETYIPPGGPFRADKNYTLIICLFLTVVTLAVYNSITHNGFINFDDNQYITRNSHVQAGLTWATLKWAFTTYDAANWHPLTWISHALDYQLFKLNPAGHHYVGVMLHAINAILLFLLLQRATASTWRSLMVAALFSLHPVNVESVAWAAERKNLLSAFFFLLAFKAYGEYARKVDVRRYCAVVFLFAFGLMAKPQIVAFPFLLLLWDYWPLARTQTGPPASTLPDSFASRSWSWLVLEKIPFFILSAASGFITIRAQHLGDAIRTAGEFSFPLRLENAAVSYVRYLGHAFWPYHLSPMYPHLETWLPVWQVVLSSLLLLAVTGVVLSSIRRPYLIVGWLWFLGSLVPMIGIVQVGEQAMADRYAYLPFVGLFMMVVWGIADIARCWPITRRFLAVPAGIGLLVLSGMTYHQIGCWRNSETLWNYAISVTDKNFMAQDNLAQELAQQGRSEEAILHFRIAEDLHTYEPSQLLFLGLYELRHGHIQDAIDQYERVLRDSSEPEVRLAAYVNLGMIYLEAGNYPQAREAYRAAVKLNPDKPEVLIGMGLLEQRDGNMAEAVREYGRAASLQPSDIAYLLLRQALQRNGNPTQAQAAYQRAVEVSANLNQAQQEVDRLLAR